MLEEIYILFAKSVIFNLITMVNKILYYPLITKYFCENSKRKLEINLLNSGLKFTSVEDTKVVHSRLENGRLS